MDREPLPVLLARMESAARAAGAVAMGHFNEGGKTGASIAYKEGGSPVTEADHAANHVLHAQLAGLHPDIGWMSEETADDGSRLTFSRLFIVDPIDGTRAFIAGERNWTVCIGYVEAGVPVAGVVYAPALDVMFAAARGQGVRLNGVVPRLMAQAVAPYRLAGPKPMVEWLEKHVGPVTALPRVASLAYRLVGLVQGNADAALAGGKAHDWDVAAADVILSEAGLALTDFANRRLVYNRPDPSHGMLIAAADGLRTHIIASAARARAEQDAGDAAAPQKTH